MVVAVIDQEKDANEPGMKAAYIGPLSLNSQAQYAEALKAGTAGVVAVSLLVGHVGRSGFLLAP